MTASRRPLGALLLLATIGLFAACSIVTSTVDTTQALRSDGFGNAQVVPTGIDGTTVVRVTGQAPPGSDDPERVAAQEVWHHYALRFQGVDVRLSRRSEVSYSRAQLEAAFGPRPAGFDRTTIGRSVSHVVVVGVTTGSVGLLAVAGLVAFLVVRHRRRHPGPGRAPGWPGYGPPPPGYGPPGYGPPGYGPPGYGPRGYGPPRGWGPPGAGPPPGPPPPGPPPPPPTSPPSSGYGYTDRGGPPPPGPQ